MYEEDAVSHVHASVHEHSDLQGVILPAYHGKKNIKVFQHRTELQKAFNV